MSVRSPDLTKTRWYSPYFAGETAEDQAASGRCLGMEVMTRPFDRVDAPAIRCLILNAGDADANGKVASTLTEQGLAPHRQVDLNAGQAADNGLDENVIIVLICNVDAPREMAALRRLRQKLRNPPIVVISPPATGTGVRRALEAGADAFVFESELELTLVATVRAVASGQSVVPGRVRASLERPALSHRERQVLALVVDGLTNAQIAAKLFLSESTIKSHLSSVFSKLGVRSRREAAAVFMELNQPRDGALTASRRPPIPAPVSGPAQLADEA